MKLRRRIRPLIDQISRASGLLDRYERRMRSEVTILMHHRVLPGAQWSTYHSPALVVPQLAFEDEVKLLAERCRVLTVAEALDALQTNRFDERPIVCLTFDDGYEDNFTIAAPILEKAGLRGTFYITSQLVELRELLWFDQAAALWDVTNPSQWEEVAGQLTPGHSAIAPCFEAWSVWLKGDLTTRFAAVFERLHSRDVLTREVRDRFRLMTPDQVAELANRGHEIGAHTKTHPVLTQLRDEQCLREEIAGSRQQIGDWIGDTPVGFCYPNGDTDPRVVQHVHQAGYEYACAIGYGRIRRGSDFFHLNRIDVSPRRVLRDRERLDALGFRCEISLIRSFVR